MTRAGLGTLQEQLTERDYSLLRAVQKYRLLTSRQIQRLHFDPMHPTALASARACTRTLGRLRRSGVLKALARRIGGARAGSAGFVWYLGPAGERLLRDTDPSTRRGRRNYREPSRHFVLHTLAISELAVQAVEADRQDDFQLLDLQTEPANWQASLSQFGAVQTLKPDLWLTTATVEFEHHWFIEIDLDSEHLPVIVRQCLAYQTFRATGRYQAAHGLFLAVVWVVPTERRRSQLQNRITTDEKLDSQLFTVATTEQAIDLLRGVAPRATTTQPDPQRPEQEHVR